MDGVSRESIRLLDGRAMIKTVIIRFMEPHIITLECPRCEAVTNAEVKGITEEGPTDEAGGPWRVTLAACPKCGSALVGVQETYGYEDSHSVWTEPVRVWPSPRASVSGQIPTEIRKALQEAYKCLKCKAYTASVGMSGRALEAIGRHFNPQEAKPLMLGAGLQKLYDAQLIDSRLYEWGKALAQERNLAAHASGTHFNREDAEDIFKFSSSICEYVFVLSEQFSDFMKRRKKATHP